MFGYSVWWSDVVLQTPGCCRGSLWVWWAELPVWSWPQEVPNFQWLPEMSSAKPTCLFLFYPGRLLVPLIRSCAGKWKVLGLFWCPASLSLVWALIVCCCVVETTLPLLLVVTVWAGLVQGSTPQQRASVCSCWALQETELKVGRRNFNNVSLVASVGRKLVTLVYKFMKWIRFCGHKMK